MEDTLRAKEERCTFLEQQFKRALDDKAELDAKHRAEAADVRNQKAEAIKERDEWKARFEQAQQAGGRERELELLRNRVRDTLAEIKLKEAVWDRKEQLAHQTATHLAARHNEDLRLAEVQRKMAAQKDKTARERESALEHDVHTVRTANKTLQAALDHQGRLSTVRELQALTAQNQELKQRLAVADMTTHAYKTEVDRQAAIIRRHEAQQFELQQRATEAEAAHLKLHIEWVNQQQLLEQTRKMAEQLRSELIPLRGEKQLLERRAAKIAEKRKQDTRSVQSQASTVASQKVIIDRLSEQVATLSGKAVEPDVSALSTTGRSKRARTESAEDISSARISPDLSPPQRPSPTPAAGLGKRPVTRNGSSADSDSDDDDEEPYTFGSTQRPKRTVSGSSTASFESVASTSTMNSTVDAAMDNGSLSPTSSKESTPRPRSVTPAAVKPGPPASASRSTADRQPAPPQEMKTSPAQSHSSTLNLQGLELSDSDDEIVCTGEKLVRARTPIKPLPQRKGPIRPPPPFPMTFSQFPFSQQRPH